MHVKVPYRGGVLASGSNRLETFSIHSIHVKVPYSGGLILFPTDSKLSQYIESMWKYLTVVDSCFEQIQNFVSTTNPSESTFYWWCTSGLNTFETVSTHPMHVKVPYSGGVLVVWTDSTLFQHIESMWKYLLVLVYQSLEQIQNFLNTSNPCESTL